uniref:DUF5806 family protein n=1 Tax=Halomicrobium zhouii TaxID=767519 RepID=UPI000B7F3968
MGASGDEDAEDLASGGETDDAGPAPGDGDSFRRDEPLPVDDDQAEDDGVDESAAVQAAQELVESERAGETADGQETADATDEAGDADSSEAEAGQEPGDADGVEEPAADVPDDVRKYDRFKKIDGGTYDRANEFLRDRTYITAREWAMARLCADFRTETGVEMTKIGENLPELVPFMTDTYTPQAVNQARAAFEEKVRKAGATFLYGAMCDFFTAEELDDVMYEATEVAKFLLEVEGVELSVEEELAAEDHISEVMRDVREHSAALRHDEVTCPECGHEIHADD